MGNSQPLDGVNQWGVIAQGANTTRTSVVHNCPAAAEPLSGMFRLCQACAGSRLCQACAGSMSSTRRHSLAQQTIGTAHVHMPLATSLMMQSRCSGLDQSLICN